MRYYRSLYAVRVNQFAVMSRGILQLERDGCRAATGVRLSVERTNPCKSLEGGSRIACFSWLLTGSHSILLFLLNFPSHVLPCATSYRSDSTQVLCSILCTKRICGSLLQPLNHSRRHNSNTAHVKRSEEAMQQRFLQECLTRTVFEPWVERRLPY